MRARTRLLHRLIDRPPPVLYLHSRSLSFWDNFFGKKPSAEAAHPPTTPTPPPPSPPSTSPPTPPPAEASTPVSTPREASVDKDKKSKSEGGKKSSKSSKPSKPATLVTIIGPEISLTSTDATVDAVEEKKKADKIKELNLIKQLAVYSAAASAAAGVDDGKKEDREILDGKLTPEEIVKELDKFIIGQSEAKKAVALALRGRWRRRALPPALQKEVRPMNILMIGPTGTGKTEIARRLAQLAQAPFTKVEATKYTEVGIYGANTEQMIQDLVENAISIQREKRRQANQGRIVATAKAQILKHIQDNKEKYPDIKDLSNEAITLLYEDDKLNHLELEISYPTGPPSVIAVSGTGKDLDDGLSELINGFLASGPSGRHSRGKTTKFKGNVLECRKRLEDNESVKLLERENQNELIHEAIRAAEESGIVVVDELDKLAQHSGDHSNYRKGEGVQKELLALFEGTDVKVRGSRSVNTSHILFIGSGAFHQSKPADLLPELQGRLPIRVQLEALKEQDYYRILTETEFNLVVQQRELLKTEGVELEFTDDALREIARLTYELNTNIENIGARRLNTIIAKVMADLSFNAPKSKGGKVTIDKAYVREKMGDLLQKLDLTKFIL